MSNKEIEAIANTLESVGIAISNIKDCLERISKSINTLDDRVKNLENRSGVKIGVRSPR